MREGKILPLNNHAPVFSDWRFVCQACSTPRDLKQPDPLNAGRFWSVNGRMAGAISNIIEVNMLPVSYRANSAFYPQKGDLHRISGPARRRSSAARTAKVNCFSGLPKSIAFPSHHHPTIEIRAALVAAQRDAEWDDSPGPSRDGRTGNRPRNRPIVPISSCAKPRPSGKAWFESGIIDRGQVQNPTLIGAVEQRTVWARRYDPIRLTIEHDRFRAEHIHERRTQHESINVMEPDRLICDAIGDPTRMARYTGS